jgi:transcriptional regulator with XRE-family HTH domain
MTMTDPAPKPFGAYVKRLRETHGLTQEELADRCGLSADTIRRLEHGAFSPSLHTIRKAAKGFDLSVVQLFEGFEVDGHDEETGDLVALVRGRGPRTIAVIIDLVRMFLRALDGPRDGNARAQPRSGP